MTAAKKGNMGIVWQLIKHGASVNLTDKVNQTVFQSVCIYSILAGRLAHNSHDCMSTELMSFKPSLPVGPVTSAQ